MSNFEFEEKLCKNCGHELEFHLKGENGRCKGDASENKGYQWCIANCEKFWE